MLPRAEHSEGAGSLPMGLSPPVMQWFCFLEKLFFLIICRGVCQCVGLCTRVQCPSWPAEGVQFFGVGVTGGCELPDVDAGN